MLPTPTDSSRWIEQWQSARIGLSLKQPALPERRNQPDWVAVAYADHHAAGSPAPLEVLDAAIDTGCSTFLIDTFRKDGLGTFHWLTMDELHKVRRQTSEHGLQFALAGQLNEQRLSEINAIRPDILAVRGAVCEGRDRRSTISGSRLRNLRQQLTNLPR